MNKKFSQQWLEIQCSIIPGTHSAILMVPDQKKDRMQALAVWPEDLAQNNDFAGIVKYALKKQTQICIPKGQTIDKQAYDLFALQFWRGPPCSA